VSAGGDGRRAEISVSPVANVAAFLEPMKRWCGARDAHCLAFVAPFRDVYDRLG